MKLILLFALALFSANFAYAEEDQCDGLNPVVFHTPGANFEKFDRTAIVAHGSYWGAQGNTVLLGGPFPDKALGMMVLAEGLTYAQADSLAQADPAVKGGFLVAEVKCWEVKINHTKK